MIIAYNILPDEIEEFKAGFIKRRPVPTNDQGVPLMTEQDWMQECGRHYFQTMYEQGARQIAHDAAQTLNSVIKVGQGAP